MAHGALNLAKALQNPSMTFTGFWGVIASVTTGPPATVGVQINGGGVAVTARRDSAYIPTVGDTVYGRMTSGRDGPDYLVEGKTAS